MQISKCWKSVPRATSGNSAMQGHSAIQGAFSYAEAFSCARVFSYAGHSAKHGFSVVIGAIWTCISIRSAAARCALIGSGKTIIPEEHQNLNLYLHVNKSIKSSIAPQPPYQKTLYLILPIKEPFGRTRIQYASKGIRLSPCNCPIGIGKSPCQRTPLPIIPLHYLLCIIHQKSSI